VRRSRSRTVESKRDFSFRKSDVKRNGPQTWNGRSWPKATAAPENFVASPRYRRIACDNFDASIAKPTMPIEQSTAVPLQYVYSTRASISESTVMDR
jgi:hypothetical protein